MHLRRRNLFSLVIAAAVIACAQGAAWADVIADHEKLLANYRQQLATLADDANRQSLAAEAKRCRDWLPQPAPLVMRLPVITQEGMPTAPADASAAAQQWHAKFVALRQRQAESLYGLAKQSMKEKRPSLAWQLAQETLREDPDHAAARRALGYQLHEGRWLTSFELKKAKAKQVWTSKFGWLPDVEVPRYEAGERYYRGKWISAAEEAELRSRIDRGWEVMTEHFIVHTNHSLEAGVKLGEHLERLSRVWHTLFITFEATESELTSWLEGKTAPRKTPPQHHVWFFRDRDEYVKALQDEQPWIANTTGYYDNDKRRSYLYAGITDYWNVYHEATHQLFAELRGGRNPVAAKANFWVIEGIACYMESLAERDGFYELDGNVAVRLADARVRLLRDDFYEPLAKLVQLGMLDLQKHAEIAKLYSQSAGLTWFLMHDGDGEYRDQLVEYLIRIYRGRDNPATLSDLTGRDYTQLDQAYAEFLRKLQATVERAKGK